MSAVVDPAAFATLEGMRTLGFEGMLRPGALRAYDALQVPAATGVYAVLREPAPPRWLARSTAAVWRGMDPSEKEEALAERWVPDTALLFVGVAAGPGVRHLLQQRIKRMLRFGQGRVVAHWSGRRVWQLADHAELRIAWLPSDAPGDEAAVLLAAFAGHHGRGPFAQDAAAEAGADA